MTQLKYTQEFKRAMREEHYDIAYQIFKTNPSLVSQLSTSSIIGTFSDFYNLEMQDEAEEFLNAVRQSPNKKAKNIIEFVDLILQAREASKN